MINTSKLAVMAVAAAGVTSPASKYIGNFGSLLLTMARCFYDAHMQKVQMRLAPTRRMGVTTERVSAETDLQSGDIHKSNSIKLVGRRNRFRPLVL